MSEAASPAPSLALPEGHGVAGAKGPCLPPFSSCPGQHRLGCPPGPSGVTDITHTWTRSYSGPSGRAAGRGWARLPLDLSRPGTDFPGAGATSALP